MSNAFENFCQRTQNLIVVKFQCVVYLQLFTHFETHLILSRSLSPRMFCWCKDGRVDAGLSKNHSDMIFSANRWPKSRRSCCSEKPFEPAVVQTTSMCLFGIYCPLHHSYLQCRKTVPCDGRYRIEPTGLQSLFCRTDCAVELWIGYLFSLSFLLQL